LLSVRVSETCLTIRPSVNSSMRFLKLFYRRRLAAKLAVLLRSQHVAVRREAAISLNRMGRAAAPAVPALSDALRDRDPYVREWSADTLAKVGRAAIPAIPNLIRCLVDETGIIQANARYTLQGLGRIRRFSEAVAVLDAMDPYERMTAIEQLGPLASGLPINVPPAIAALCQRASGSREAISQITPQQLVEVIRDYRSGIRVMAIAALREMGASAEVAVPALIEVLDDEPLASGLVIDGVADAAMWTLANIGPLAAAALPALLKRVPENPTAALFAIGSIGPAARAAAPELVELLRDAQLYVKVGVAVALWRIGERDPQIEEVLRSAYEATVDPGVRVSLMHRIEETDLVALRIRALYDECGDVVVAAACGLGNLGELARSAVPRLTEIATGDSFHPRFAAALALQKIAPESPEWISVLAELVGSAVNFRETREDGGAVISTWGLSTPADRVQVAKSLGEMGGAAISAVPALKLAARDEDEHLRNAAAAAIERIEVVGR